jgi:hypothetical protein
MSLSVKDSVRLTGIAPQMILAAIVAEGVYRDENAPCVITSCIDSKHRIASLHYVGHGLDLRTNNLLPEVRQTVADSLRERLGTEFDVILEDDHIHVEWQPKGHLTDG